MSATTISPLDTVEARRLGAAANVLIRVEADLPDRRVTLVLRPQPEAPADERLIEDLELTPGAAARLVGLLIEALDLVDPDMASVARIMAALDLADDADQR